MDKLIDNFSNLKIKKNTSGGGKNTNISGLAFENITCLNFKLIDTDCEIKNKILSYKINFIIDDLVINKELIYIYNKRLLKYMNHNKLINNTIKPANGCKQPDECYINMDDKILFIIEKKFQKGSGSVSEKLQTAVFKREHYNKLYPEFKTVYIFVLCDFYKTNHDAELDYFRENDIPVYWGEETGYKKQLTEFIVNYK